jgi:hypothetical protein
MAFKLFSKTTDLSYSRSIFYFALCFDIDQRVELDKTKVIKLLKKQLNWEINKQRFSLFELFEKHHQRLIAEENA